MIAGLPRSLPGADRGDGAQRWHRGGIRNGEPEFGGATEAVGEPGHDIVPGEDNGAREGRNADRCEGRPLLSDANGGGVPEEDRRQSPSPQPGGSAIISNLQERVSEQVTRGSSAAEHDVTITEPKKNENKKKQKKKKKKQKKKKKKKKKKK